MRGKAAFVILWVLSAAIFAALALLGRRTAPAWLLGAAAFAALIALRVRAVPQAFWGRAALWIGFCAALALIWRVTAPPVRTLPAVDAVAPRATEIVTTPYGQLTGVYTEDGGVEVYAGIPYAKPPVGALRWREPQAPEPWEGVRACDRFAPMSMQKRGSTVFSSLTELAVYHTFRPRIFGNCLEAMSEDSLYLNIWKPAGAAEGLPVLLFIHGGSLTGGQPSYSEYNGESLARRGVIVVNFGYRLNVFGYLASEALAAESEHGTTGNYGLLDQIAALRWVHENIALFGGDPEKITVAGESAGASSVNALCVSPLTEGLFRYAVAESSGITAKRPYHTFRTRERALKMGADIFAEFGASSPDELRAVDAETLVNTKHTNDAMTVDGYAITEQPYLTYARGANHEQALLSGFNAHEADLFALFHGKVTKEHYAEALRRVLGGFAEEGAALVPPAPVDPAYRVVIEAGGDAKGAYDRVLSAAWFDYSHFNWARLLTQQGVPVYQYRFTKDNGSLGANHGGEMPYAYGNLHRHAWCYGADDAALSEQMQAYWANFVKTGDPNGAGLPVWRPFAEDPALLMELGAETGMTEDPGLALYAVIDKYQDAQP